MFKKDPQVKASANIKSSDRKKLLSQITSIYSLPTLPKPTQLELVPQISKKATYKAQFNSGTIYFSQNEIPIYFQPRDGSIYPTVYTLWKCPFLLPQIKTHPHVIDIVSGGADLMIPGTIPPFSEGLRKGAVVGVVSDAKPGVVMAIGVLLVDMFEFDRVIGKTGVAVEIIHHYCDGLAKFNKEVDVAIPESVDIEMPREEKEDTPETEDTQAEDTPQESAAEETPEVEEQVEITEQVAQLSVEEIDNFFIRSLLQTIKLEQVELPIPSSQFMSQYIYKNLPKDVSYNIKHTSWKKTSKFLKAMTKLTYLETKGKDDDVIVKLMDSKSPLIVSFEPHKINKPKSNTEIKEKNDMKITLLYKPTSKSRMFFNKLDLKYDEIYTASELRKMFEMYVKKFNLAQTKSITIDEILSKVVNKPNGTTIARDQVFKEFQSNFSPYYQISTSTQSEIFKGTPPKISIITEMKIGRKIITRVSNFEKFYIKPGAFAEELRNKCSGSSTIGPATHNPSITEVQVQGPHGKLIIEILKEKGIPISAIEFEDKVKKKKKRT
ncbi:Translation machinery-associated protein 64 [Spathaspora sp. JA1]|nr:Translation machinery-associated protein 64 [Spathaspora sp. JA1]